MDEGGSPVGSQVDQATMADDARLLGEVERALEGDGAALAALYERFRASVQACAMRVVGDPHEAEDVTQQVFLKLMTSLGTFRPARGSFQGWLLQVTRNAALDHVRRRRAFPAAEVYGPDVAATPGVSPLRGPLLSALADVPERQLQVLFLLHVGFSPAEVARAMGTSEGAVHVLHHRARRRLLPVLTAEGLAPATRHVRPPARVAYDRRGARTSSSRTAQPGARRRRDPRPGDRDGSAAR
jgi:RNA polymerase sigma-70 factor (ECF subfamily)